MGTSGSEGGPGKPTNRKAGRAPRSDPYTYVWTLAGFVYVAFLVDVFSRRILGWRVMSSKHTPLVTSVVEQALFTRQRGEFAFTPTGLVHHSDAGSQYTSIAFSAELREAGITGSIGSVGDALDNALMESTIGLYKTELIDVERLRSWTGRAEVERETAAWVHWYNTSMPAGSGHRRHGADSGRHASPVPPSGCPVTGHAGGTVGSRSATMSTPAAVRDSAMLLDVAVHKPPHRRE